MGREGHVLIQTFQKSLTLKKKFVGPRKKGEKEKFEFPTIFFGPLKKMF